MWRGLRFPVRDEARRSPGRGQCEATAWSEQWFNAGSSHGNAVSKLGSSFFGAAMVDRLTVRRCGEAVVTPWMRSERLVVGEGEEVVQREMDKARM
jgi:hypothetical protein